MALKAWIKDGALVVDGSGHPILCETCPCGGFPATCCDPDTLPLTATATLTVNGTLLGSWSLDLFNFGSTFEYSNSTASCDTHVNLIPIAAACNGDGLWGVLVSFSRDDINQACLWEWGSDTNPESFTVSCSPFHFHYEGYDWDDAMMPGLDTLPNPTCGVPINAHGANLLVMDIVTP